MDIDFELIENRRILVCRFKGTLNLTQLGKYMRYLSNHVYIPAKQPIYGLVDLRFVTSVPLSEISQAVTLARYPLPNRALTMIVTPNPYVQMLTRLTQRTVVAFQLDLRSTYEEGLEQLRKEIAATQTTPIYHPQLRSHSNISSNAPLP